MRPMPDRWTKLIRFEQGIPSTYKIYTDHIQAFLDRKYSTLILISRCKGIIITAPIRRMGEGNIFSLCVSPHLDRGYPLPRSRPPPPVRR